MATKKDAKIEEKKPVKAVKTAAAKTAAAKAAAAKAAAAKAPAKKEASAKKPAKAEEKVAKPAAKKTAAAKPVAEKKPAVKKAAATKAPAKTEAKAAKAAAKKTAAKTTAKAPAKAAAAKKPAAKKSVKAKVEEVVEKVPAKKAEAASLKMEQSFDAEYLVLMQKDPNWMHAFWEVSEKRIKQAQKGKSKLVLRLFDISNDLTVMRSKKRTKFRDVVVPADARSWYVENTAGKACTAVLGAVEGNKFMPIVESLPIVTFDKAAEAPAAGNAFVAASLGGNTLGNFMSSGFSSQTAESWLKSLGANAGFGSSSESMFSGALSSAALKSNAGVEAPKDSVNYGKDFFLWVKTRLIVYGGTRPDAHLQVRGEDFPLNPDGTFSFEEDLPDSNKVIPVFATDKDGDFPTTIVPIVVKRTE